MPYEDFPRFKKESVEVICNVEEPSPGHFYWPQMDLDLSEAIISNPQQFPLKAKLDYAD